MLDFYEIDFLNVESKKSGDAIPLRYSINGVTRIHITDGGFQDTGDKVVQHVNKYYNYPNTIDAVIVSHPDGDHAGGLRAVLETFNVSELWMLRPWLYADELIRRFTYFSNVENLVRRLKEVYPNIAALEEIAVSKGVPIREPFQGAVIGEFIVLAPTKERYLDLVVESEKTPEAAEGGFQSLFAKFSHINEKTLYLREVAWGEETFSSEETSPENDMSVIQYANLCGEKILLTADAGRGALTEAADYAPWAGLVLPGIDRFQVPHHGSRRNVSTTEILDRWLGARLPEKLEDGAEEFTAIISASKEDKDHPRKAVIRACIHRGAKVISNEGQDIYIFHNAPDRDWYYVQPLPYPEEQEED